MMSAGSAARLSSLKSGHDRTRRWREGILPEIVLFYLVSVGCEPKLDPELLNRYEAFAERFLNQYHPGAPERCLHENKVSSVEYGVVFTRCLLSAGVR